MYIVYCVYLRHRSLLIVDQAIFTTFNTIAMELFTENYVVESIWFALLQNKAAFYLSFSVLRMRAYRMNICAKVHVLVVLSLLFNSIQFLSSNFNMCKTQTLHRITKEKSKKKRSEKKH